MSETFDVYVDQFTLAAGPYGVNLNFSRSGPKPGAPGSVPQAEDVGALRLRIGVSSGNEKSKGYVMFSNPLPLIQESKHNGTLLYNGHALRRMIERGLLIEQVEEMINSPDAELLCNYPQAGRSCPECLILGRERTGKWLHVLVTYPVTEVITAYEPMPPKWVTPSVIPPKIAAVALSSPRERIKVRGQSACSGDSPSPWPLPSREKGLLFSPKGQDRVWRLSFHAWWCPDSVGHDRFLRQQAR